MKQLRNGDWAVGFLPDVLTIKQEHKTIPIAPPQPIFFPKFQIFFADFPNSTFLPLARDCASWEPAADISTARFVNEWYFSSSPRFSRLDEKRLLFKFNYSFRKQFSKSRVSTGKEKRPKLSKECNKNILFSWVKTAVLRTSLIRKREIDSFLFKERINSFLLSYRVLKPKGQIFSSCNRQKNVTLPTPILFVSSIKKKR